MGVKLVYKGLNPDNTVREFRRIMGDKLWEMAKSWWERYLPRHFHAYSGARYAMSKRSYKYQKDKLKKKKHADYLRWEGNFERMATGAATITKSYKQGSAKYKAPKYVWMSQYQGNRKGKMPNLVVESQMLDRGGDEIKTLTSELEKGLIDSLNNVSEVKIKEL